jgi:CelD/BcsL family acetyltransferase involved in cellulose biosynthesis
MNALFYLPYARSAAEAAIQTGSAAVQMLTESLSDAGDAFAQVLTANREEAEKKAEKIAAGVQDPSDASAMLALVDQIQSQLQAALQSMGLQLDQELNLSIDQDGKVAIDGESDSAAVLEQIINSDPALQAQMAALKRACKASGEADQLEARLRYQANEITLEVEEPAASEGVDAEAEVIAV